MGIILNPNNLYTPAIMKISKDVSRLLNKLRIRIEIRRGITKAGSYPTTIIFLMVDKCNSKCIMCGGSYFNSTSGDMITFDLYKRMLKNLQTDYIAKIKYGGFGEPLLNPHLRDIVEYTTKHYPHIDQILVTNAIAMNEDISKFLVKHLYEVKMSVNAATSETYRKIHQIDRFDEVIENIRRLSCINKEKGGKCELMLSFVAMRRNIEELPSAIDLASDLGLDSVFSWYCRFYPKRFRYHDYDEPKNRLEDGESLFYHQELSDKCYKIAEAKAMQHGIRFIHEPLFASKFNPTRCVYPWVCLYIGSKGELYPCPAGEIVFKEKVESGTYDTGNILKQHISAIWNNEFYRDLRSSVINQKNPKISECAACGNNISHLGPDNERFHILNF